MEDLVPASLLSTLLSNLDPLVPVVLGLVPVVPTEQLELALKRALSHVGAFVCRLAGPFALFVLDAEEV